LNQHHPPIRRERIDALGASLLIGFSALLGLNQVMMKLVNAGMSPVFQAGLRSAVALVPVLLWALWRGRPILPRGGALAAALVCGTIFGLEFLLLFKALDFTSVTRTSVLFYTMPIWVAVMAHFLIPGDTLTRRKLAGLALAVAGVAVALARDDHPATELSFVGDLMALAGAAGWATIAIVTRVTSFSRMSPEAQLLWQLVVSAPLLLTLAPLFGPVWREMTPGLWAIFLFQAIVVVAIAYMVWFWVLSVYPASDMASFAFLTPLFGVGFGWLILGEKLTLNVVASLALVGAGIWLVNRRPKAP